MLVSGLADRRRQRGSEIEAYRWRRPETKRQMEANGRRVGGGTAACMERWPKGKEPGSDVEAFLNDM